MKISSLPIKLHGIQPKPFFSSDEERTKWREWFSSEMEEGLADLKESRRLMEQEFFNNPVKFKL